MAHKWHYRCKPGCSLLLKMVYYCLVSETVTITNGVLLVSETPLQMVCFGLVIHLPLQIVYYLLVRQLPLLIVYYWSVRLTASLSGVVTSTGCREYQLYVNLCVCMCACMITSLTCFKINTNIQQYETILTPNCYFCATHFPNCWFRNFEKEISIHAVALCPVLFAVPKNIVSLPCLLNSTISNWYCIALNERREDDWWIMNWKESTRHSPWPNLRYSYGISWKRLKNPWECFK
jgi:hypothetical protein